MMNSTTTTTTTLSTTIYSSDSDSDEKDKKPVRITTKVVSFKDGPLGITYTGSTVSKVIPGGQADKNGVKIGWVILEVNDEEQPVNNSQDIFDKIKSLKKDKTPIEILFKMDLGVKPEKVADIVSGKEECEIYKRGHERAQSLHDIVLPNGNDVVEKHLWSKMNDVMERTRSLQINKPKSAFTFEPNVHRFPDTHAFDFNAMTNYIGSWMGDFTGLMQWPVKRGNGNRVLQYLISQNNVQIIVALGKREKNERLEMGEYWKTIGASWEQIKNNHCDQYLCKGIPPTTDHNCQVYHFPKWPDMGSPSKEQIINFNWSFEQLKKVEERGGRVLIHCRAGVGRSGTYRLMYKAWKGEFNLDGIAKAVHDQRALRMNTVQTRSQYTFLQAYVQDVEKPKSKRKSYQDIAGDCFNDKKYMEAAFWFYQYKINTINPFQHHNYKNFDVAIANIGPMVREKYSKFLRRSSFKEAATWEECDAAWKEKVKELNK